LTLYALRYPVIDGGDTSKTTREGKGGEVQREAVQALVDAAE